MSRIRKISVGLDYKSAMHYIVGQPILDNTHTIHAIEQNKDGSHSVWIQDEAGTIVCWKRFSELTPITIEYNIHF